MCTQYTNKNEVAIDFSRRREHERSTSRRFVRLIVLGYKRARQSRQLVVRIQLALCEVACKENNRGLKKSFVSTLDRITNKHIIVVSIKSLIETKHIFGFTLFAINELIF